MLFQLDFRGSLVTNSTPQLLMFDKEMSRKVGNFGAFRRFVAWPVYTSGTAMKSTYANPRSYWGHLCPCCFCFLSSFRFFFSGGGGKGGRGDSGQGGI